MRFYNHLMQEVATPDSSFQIPLLDALSWSSNMVTHRVFACTSMQRQFEASKQKRLPLSMSMNSTKHEWFKKSSARECCTWGIRCQAVMQCLKDFVSFRGGVTRCSLFLFAPNVGISTLLMEKPGRFGTCCKPSARCRTSESSNGAQKDLPCTGTLQMQMGYLYPLMYSRYLLLF